MKLKTIKILGFVAFLCLFLTVNITVSKLTTASGEFQFSTYFGGSDDESQEDGNDLGKMSVELDKDDNIIVVGRTRSTDYPVTLTIPGQFAEIQTYLFRNLVQMGIHSNFLPFLREQERIGVLILIVT